MKINRVARRKPQPCLVIEGQVLSGDAAWPVAEIGIVHFKKFRSDRGRAGDYHIDRAQPETEQRPIVLGKGLHGLVRSCAELQKVAQHRQPPWARRKRSKALGLFALPTNKNIVEERGHNESGEKEKERSHCFVHYLVCT